MASGAAAPVGAEVPADPIGNSSVAVVAQGVLGLAEQVVGGLIDISGGTAGVTEGKVFRKGLGGRDGSCRRRGSYGFVLAGS